MKPARSKYFLFGRKAWRVAVWRYLQSILLVLLALVVSIPLHFIIEPVNLVMLFLAAVVVAAAFLGRGPAILASVLSVLIFDFFLVQPRLSFSVADTEYLLTFFGLLVVGLVISTTVAQLRSQFDIIRQREANTAALNSLSQDLTGAINLEDMLNSVVRHIHQSFSSRVVVLLPDKNNLYLAADSENRSSLEETELEAAGQVFRQTAQPAETLPSGSMQFLPLRTSLGVVGVLGIATVADRQSFANQAQRNLLQGFANLAALAIERARLAEQAEQAQVLKNTERLQSALLSSISHELRTPLVSITGALSTLAEINPENIRSPQEKAARQELIDTAYEEAQRMNLLVGNLLDMSRLESGALRLSLEPCDLQDLVGITLDRFSQQHCDRMVITRLEDDLPLIDLDVSLMVEVLVNLLRNADKYSPKDVPILLACRRDGGMIEIEVNDQGPGVASEDLERIFDKFYRSANVRHVTGLGLGLSISKGIVEAHKGYIEARNRPGGGLSIFVHLPGAKNGVSHE